MEKQANKFVKAAKSKYSKAKRTFTCRSLKDLIKAYRACTTSADERALVKKESAHIRDLFKEGDATFRRVNIAKLLFFHMNGYPTNFGMTECVKLCASDKFSDKRVAYLGLMILVDETDDILMLITNSLKQDLSSHNHHIVGLALTVLADLASAEMARDLLPEIETHLDSPLPYLRKKAALASVRAVRKLSHDETANVLAAAPRLLESSSPRTAVTGAASAHIAGTALIVALARQHPSNLAHLRRAAVPALVAVLRGLLLSSPVAPASPATGAPRGTGVLRHPFTQINVLRALRMISSGQGVPREVVNPISDVLAQVASNTDATKTIGTAVLYECVRTIVALNVDDSLRSLAVSTLGCFLSHKDPNVRYVALQELVKVVSISQPENDLQRYLPTVLECLRETDPTIKHRALELLYAIACPANVTQLAEQLITFIRSTAESELRESACRKLCSIADQFGPSLEWRVDIFMAALGEVDCIMPEYHVSSFLAMVSCEPSIQAYTANAMFHAGLLQGAAFSIPSSVAVGGSNTGDPFEMPILGAVSLRVERDMSRREKKHRKRRRPRLERVSLYVFGEYGDSVIGQIISIDDAVSTVERILATSSVGIVSFSTTSLPLDTRDDWYAQEVSLVREASMAALVKIAARFATSLPGSSETDNQFSRLGSRLALAASAAPLARSDGLGTDLLAGLGISDSPPAPLQFMSTGPQIVALVPSSGVGLSLLEDSSASNGDFLSMKGVHVDIHPVLLRVRRILALHRRSMDIETQQRACEYSGLLTGEMAGLRALTLDRTPPMDFAAIQERMARAASSSGGGVNLNRSVHASGNEASVPGGQAPFSKDLLCLLDNDTEPVKPSRLAIGGPSDLQSLTDSAALSVSPLAARPSGYTTEGGIEDSTWNDVMKGGSVSALASSSQELSDAAQVAQHSQSASPPTDHAVFSDKNPYRASVAAPEEKTSGEAGTAQIVDSNSLRISALFFKDDPNDSGTTRVEFSFSNKSSSQTYSQFVFQLAVPKYMQTDMHPASSSILGPGSYVTQTVVLTNPQLRKVKLQYRCVYAVESGEEVIEQGLCANLPEDL
jgi:hypothetical protein